MATEEKSKLLILQQRKLDQKDAQASEAACKYDALVDRMDRMLAKQDESVLESAKMLGLVEEQFAQIRIFEKEKRDLALGNP